MLAGHDTLMLEADRAGILQAAALIRAGECVAFPTETVYGLGADATNGRAVAGIYAAKGRPSFNPLIAHVHDLAAAERLGVFDDLSRRLGKAFWPGPLTLVVPKAPGCTVSELATAGHDSIAIRVPRGEIALALIAAAGVPIAAPSANLSGHVSPTSASHVRADLDGRIAAIIAGETTAVGVESTILQVRDGRLLMLRPGGLSREEIERVAGVTVEAVSGPAADGPVAPGMLASHYAPNARVRLNAVSVDPDEALLGFGQASIAGSPRLVRNLSPSGDVNEAAANLFGMLRELDQPGILGIAVAEVPMTGLGEAINDRLNRAAAER